MKHLSLLLALSLLMLGLGACGQSGPLYLPPPPNKTPAQLQSTPKAVPPSAPGPQLNQMPNNPDPNMMFNTDDQTTGASSNDDNHDSADD